MFELDQPKASSKDLVQAERRAFNTLKQAVIEGVEMGYLKGDPNTLAHLYWTSLHGVVVLDLTGKLVHGRSKRTLLRSLFDGAFTSARS